MVFGFGKGKEPEKPVGAKSADDIFRAAPAAPGVAAAVPPQSASMGAAKPTSLPRGRMVGMMQDWPLTVDKVLSHAHENHGHQEIVARTVEGPIARTTYSDLYWRSRQLSNALLADGVQQGDRIATLGR
jgi:hypothetical protein